ncbi:MAG: DUF4097 family beta strand repeat-containing protein [Chloroflexota bacterium]|nr:DUF4097 family beta strand repeat-containing protein [Chloroflexota bacterium]
MDNNNRNTTLIVIVLAIFSCCCIIMMTGGALIGTAGWRLAQDFDDLAKFDATNTFSQTFSVDTPAELEVDIAAGSVTVTVGEGNMIQVDTEIRAYDVSSERAQEALDKVRYSATQSGSKVNVRGEWSNKTQWRARSPEINVRVSVPRRTDIEVKVDVGKVHLQDVTGEIDIETGVGRVDIENVTVPDDFRIRTDVADMNFTGSLNEGSDYTFQSDVGAIKLTLPANSRFELDASSDVGSVLVDFDIEGEISRDFVGKSVKGVVGGESDTKVSVQTNVGAILIRQQ